MITINLQVELDFRAGDVIMVYGTMDDDGFYVGEVNGQLGLVPSNFLSTDTAGLQSAEPILVVFFCFLCTNIQRTHSDEDDVVTCILSMQRFC